VRIAIFLLSFLGLLVSLYFTGVTYRWLEPDARFVPAFCRMTRGSCLSILESREAQLFGVPNSVLGIAYYVAMIGTALLATRWLILAALAATGMAVAMGAYLCHALVYRLKTPCPLCFAGHGINLVLLGLLAGVAAG
jgi:uncharacterized membrane protein